MLVVEDSMNAFAVTRNLRPSGFWPIMLISHPVMILWLVIMFKSQVLSLYLRDPDEALPS